MNLYAFVGNSAVGAVDRFGLQAATRQQIMTELRKKLQKWPQPTFAVEAGSENQARNWVMYWAALWALYQTNATESIGPEYHGNVCSKCCVSSNVLITEFTVTFASGVGEMVIPFSPTITCPDGYAAVGHFHSHPLDRPGVSGGWATGFQSGTADRARFRDPDKFSKLQLAAAERQGVRPSQLVGAEDPEALGTIPEPNGIPTVQWLDANLVVDEIISEPPRKPDFIYRTCAASD